MTVDKVKLKALIAECRYGVSGKGPAIEVANDLLGDCCDNLESLLAEIERLEGLRADAPPRPPEGDGLPRYGLRWNGPTSPVSVPRDDGYWTPWHLADQLKVENEALRQFILGFAEYDAEMAYAYATMNKQSADQKNG